MIHLKNKMTNFITLLGLVTDNSLLECSIYVSVNHLNSYIN